MTLDEYMDPKRFPLTTRPGASPSFQLAIDEFEHWQMREHLRRGGPMDEARQARRAELEAKMAHYQRLAAEVREQERREREAASAPVS
jgi:hypothetical protein